MGGGSVPIVAKNVSARRIFATIPGKIMAVPPDPTAFPRQRGARGSLGRSAAGFTPVHGWPNSCRQDRALRPGHKKNKVPLGDWERHDQIVKSNKP
ncbi:hypothetical protein BDHH15_65350 [Bradyrhizobium diazoefficiens]|nr:hypothetical protein BDHH15_65350 [Bradyrhizobium diazoefficiens]